MKRWLVISLVILTSLTLISEFFIPHDPAHAKAWWSGIPFFWAIFGFAGCVILIYLAKYILKAIVQRKENYYDEL